VNGTPCRSKTHFVEATILEIMRHCPHMALTVQHFALEDTTIGGHVIPRGTQVRINFETRGNFVFG
jgi:cytochrome P450